MPQKCRRPDCDNSFNQRTFWQRYCSRKCGVVVRGRRHYQKEHPICKACLVAIPKDTKDNLCPECTMLKDVKQAEPQQGLKPGQEVES